MNVRMIYENSEFLSRAIYCFCPQEDAEDLTEPSGGRIPNQTSSISSIGGNMGKRKHEKKKRR